MLTTAGYAIGTNSGAQRGAGADVAFAQGRAGDIVGWNGHVAVYLGQINGVAYVLEAPSGRPRGLDPAPDTGSHDAMLHRYWKRPLERLRAQRGTCSVKNPVWVFQPARRVSHHVGQPIAGAVDVLNCPARRPEQTERKLPQVDRAERLDVHRDLRRVAVVGSAAAGSRRRPPRGRTCRRPALTGSTTSITHDPGTGIGAPTTLQAHRGCAPR